MILLFGVRAVFRVLATLRFRCAYCGADARQRVVERANRFTFFLIPLFTLSRAYFTECTHCGGRTRISAAEARRATERVA